MTAMNSIINYKEVDKKVLTIRGENVLLDKDVTELYGVNSWKCVQKN